MARAGSITPPGLSSTMTALDAKNLVYERPVVARFEFAFKRDVVGVAGRPQIAKSEGVRWLKRNLEHRGYYRRAA